MFKAAAVRTVRLTFKIVKLFSTGRVAYGCTLPVPSDVLEAWHFGIVSHIR